MVSSTHFIASLTTLAAVVMWLRWHIRGADPLKPFYNEPMRSQPPG
jgi:hypothetical protein